MKKLIKISEHVYMYKYESKRDRPNLYYIKGDNYSVCIDAGTSMDHLYGFYKAIMQNGFTLPKYTLITHWHWDHTFALPYIAGKSISSSLTKEKLKEVSLWKWDEHSMKSRLEEKLDIPFCDKCIKKEYKNPETIKVTIPDISVKTKKLDLGNVHLKLECKNSPHSRDSLFIYCLEDNLLFIGDADCGDDYYLNGEYDSILTGKLLRYFKRINPTKILSGHNELLTLEEEEKYLKEILTLNTKRKKQK